MTTCAFVSFRLGLDDGVSVVAARWIEAFSGFGFDVVTVAGSGPVDHRVPGLAIGALAPPSRAELARVLDGVDLVVVENLLTIPMNLPASRVLAEVLRGRPALLHHHDPPWQRERYRRVTELPAVDGAWRHVTISRLTAREMRDRGIEAAVVYNGFDVDPPRGDRRSTRTSLEVSPTELLLVQPVRAIERKNIPRGIEIATLVGATLWLTGAPEEGYGATLDALLADARCRVIHRSEPDLNDLYAAADAVLFPSRWEGFGNPPIEASIRGRPVAVGRFPVAEELRGLGFEWLDDRHPPAIAAEARHPDQRVLEHNRTVARRHFSLERMRDELRGVLDDAGWLP
jgi:glycosyltransferase involved in cell wall biosynthesis